MYLREIELLRLIISDILHYLFLVTDIKKIWTGQSSAYKTQEYIEMNRNGSSAPEDNLIRICEGVIRKSENATKIASDIVVEYLSSGDNDGAKSDVRGSMKVTIII